MNNFNSLENNQLVVKSHIELFRNIKGKKFPKKLSIEEGRKLSKSILEKLVQNIINIKPINLWEVDDLEHYKNIGIINNNIIKNKEFSSIAISDEKKFTITINENEHIRLIYEKNGNNIKEIYKYLNQIDNLLENNFRYAFDDRLGYLMSDLSNLGTGLKVSITLHLPILTKLNKITNISKQLELNNLCIEGLYGEKGCSYGSFYKIYNKWCLGLSEEDIITNLENNIINIINEEYKERNNIFKKSKIEIEDKIFRSYGILKYAKKLNFIECLELLSDLRLGVECNILEFDLDDIENLIFLVKGSVIKSKIQENVNNEVIDIERANVVRKLFG